jgi:hypothetical protein
MNDERIDLSMPSSADFPPSIDKLQIPLSLYQNKNAETCRIDVSMHLADSSLPRNGLTNESSVLNGDTGVAIEGSIRCFATLLPSVGAGC